MKKVFIDGSAGTTGLRIAQRLAERKDIELLPITEELRKDQAARRDLLNKADIVFLCLPDAAAEEAVSMIGNPDVCVIDTSTVHRTADGWTYGFPEIGGRAAQIKDSKRIANPGCHASGFIALVAPLVENGILKKNARLTSYSLTGYSGGGKKMIAQYEDPDRDILLQAPRMYGLTQKHKHLPEMAAVCGLEESPVFCPVVAPYYAGMQVTVPLFRDMASVGPEEIKEVYKSYYKGPVVKFDDSPDDGGFLSAGLFSGRDDMIISVYGNEDRILMVSTFDNLGKGASGAAIQNMNLVLGVEETTGLVTGGRA
ncbi:MAG: N-acetyl-gamma-glutamyl-phosphate reductase [Spirochaetales bacterium]|nr:N-acetyl-gamma-glutamyl-phosphate reductase [Spirochaetales bacterium]